MSIFEECHLSEGSGPYEVDQVRGRGPLRLYSGQVRAMRAVKPLDANKVANKDAVSLEEPHLQNTALEEKK